MKSTFSRFIAVMLLVIPGAMATYGFLAIKDAWFAQFGAAETDPHIQWGKLFIGLILFALFVFVLFSISIRLYHYYSWKERAQKVLVMGIITALASYFIHAFLNNFLDIVIHFLLLLFKVIYCFLCLSKFGFFVY